MAGRFGPTDFAACARCGSNQVHPKLLVMGPIAGIDSDSRSYVCHACGHEGLPIFFDTEGARDQFEREKKGLWDPEPKAAAKGVVTIASVRARSRSPGWTRSRSSMRCHPRSSRVSTGTARSCGAMSAKTGAISAKT